MPPSVTRNRLAAVFALLSVLTLVDEIIKEGYGFDPHDLISPALTHEKLLIVFASLAVVLGLRKKR